MTNRTKKLIERINEVSRHFLSRILAVQKNLQTSPQNLDNDDVHSVNKENKELTELMENRQTLITRLFEQNTAKDIHAEPELVLDMITLDNQLTANAELSKKVITEQVIKIKKSKKVAKSYKKY